MTGRAQLGIANRQLVSEDAALPRRPRSCTQPSRRERMTACRPYLEAITP